MKVSCYCITFIIYILVWSYLNVYFICILDIVPEDDHNHVEVKEVDNLDEKEEEGTTSTEGLFGVELPAGSK